MEIEVKVEKIDGEIVLVFPDGDSFPITAPIHAFLFHLELLSPETLAWDGNSFTIIIPEVKKKSI